MATFTTSLGRPVSHCHVKPHPKFPCRSREWTDAQKEQKKAELEALFPEYETVELPSARFNCHGFSFAHAHAWFNDPRRFIEDDFTVEDDFTNPPSSPPRKGDLLVYRDDVEFTHSGVVEKVLHGHIRLVRSKMGSSSTVLHKPNDVHEKYGKPALRLRRNGA